MEQQLPTFASLHEIIQSASSSSSPKIAINELIEQCVAHTGASSGYLYKLDLSNSAYQCVHQVNTAIDYPEITVEVLNYPELADSLIEEAIVSCQPRMIANLDQVPIKYIRSEGSTSIMIMPVVRSANVENACPICLGVLVLEVEHETHFAQATQEFLATVASALLLLFEKEYMLSLLQNAQKTLDFRKPREEFLGDVVQLISRSSGMPFVVLRELIDEDNSLRCVALIGFDVEKHVLDLDDLENYESFKSVIETKKPRAERDMDAKHLANLRSRPELREVKSFVVVPVNVGTGIFGTLSFACSCRYPFVRLEITALECIANAIGVAIENQRNFYKHEEEMYTAMATGAAFTAVEVAQAARHEGRNHLEVATSRLALMLGYVENPTRDNLSKLETSIAKVGEALVNAGETLDKIKSISKPPLRELRLQSLKQVWNDAFNIVLGRLEIENIIWRVNGSSVEAEVYPEFLVQAFLNLVLNSIDAYRDKKKSNRLITVIIETPSAAAQDIVMKYTDNAGGIDASKLSPKVGSDPRTVEMIFEMGVTSKKSGSGFGLYLVRKILQEHQGAIDLVSHRSGVQFEIKLPKRLRR